MNPQSFRRAASWGCLALTAMLAGGCGSPEESYVALPDNAGDPMLTAALDDPIMSDLDLAQQNQANSAITVAGVSGSLPPMAESPDHIARARSDLERLMGAPGRIFDAPPPQTVTGVLGKAYSATAAMRVAGGTIGKPDCASQLEYSAIWAARMPPAFPIYPRAETQEAAGTDAGGCRVRAVTYRTPVPTGEIVDFHYTLGRRAGMEVALVEEGGQQRLSGNADGRAFEALIRPYGENGTEVELITSGR